MKFLVDSLSSNSEITSAEHELRRWSIAAGGTITLAGLVFLIWGFMAPMHGAVVAQGVVRVENNRQQIHHQEGGIIKSILVKNGDFVRKEQDLLELEDLRISANSGIIGQNIAAEMAKQARLTAERDFKEKINFPERLLAQSNNLFVSNILKKERDLFLQKRKSLQLQLDILGQQIAETGREIDAIRQQIAADQVSSKSMDDELKANASLLDKGFISPTRMFGLQRNLADYQSRVAEHQADLSRAQQKQNDLRLKQEDIRNSARQAALTELKDSFSKTSDLEEQMRPAEDAQRRQIIRSPAEGTVVNLKANTIGASIGPREPIMEIVPDNQELIVEIHLTPNSILELTLGMQAEVKLLAYDTRTTPLVSGSLKYISADVLNDPNGTTYYLGQIALDPKSLQAAQVNHVQPGMPAEVYIKTVPRTAFQYIVDPVTLSLGRAFRER